MTGAKMLKIIRPSYTIYIKTDGRLLTEVLSMMTSFPLNDDLFLLF